MAVNSSQEQCQDSLNVVELPDEGTTGPLCESHLDMVNLSNLNLVKTPISMDAQSNGGNHANLKNDSADVYGSYCLAIDIEKGKLEASKSTDEMSGNIKTDDCISRMFQREISSLMGGKFMQLLMNNSFELPKFACKDKFLTEKVYDTPSNRLRKYKRSASFNSRRVVLLFSFLDILSKLSEYVEDIHASLVASPLLLHNVEHGYDYTHLSYSES